jgi:hypothetical protein
MGLLGFVKNISRFSFSGPGETVLFPRDLLRRGLYSPGLLFCCSTTRGMQFGAADFGDAGAGSGLLAASRFVVFAFRDHDQFKT